MTPYFREKCIVQAGRNPQKWVLIKFFALSGRADRVPPTGTGSGTGTAKSPPVHTVSSVLYWTNDGDKRHPKAPGPGIL
jgi:hypothetical protein